MTVTTLHPPLATADRDTTTTTGLPQALAERLKATADPTRLRLIAGLQARPDQQACVQDLTSDTGLAQPMVSHHLQILRRAGLVNAARRGSRVFYRLDTAALYALADELVQPPG